VKHSHRHKDYQHREQANLHSQMNVDRLERQPHDWSVPEVNAERISRNATAHGSNRSCFDLTASGDQKRQDKTGYPSAIGAVQPNIRNQQRRDP
jgi:hypothetical protein